MTRKNALLVGALIALGLASSAGMTDRGAEPFKITNIHFEANESACDMGIQISFDTSGVEEGWVKDPNGRIVYTFGNDGDGEGHGRDSDRDRRGRGDHRRGWHSRWYDDEATPETHNITEGFQERVEPQIVELEQALGCERAAEEPEVSLEELLSAWPEGKYIFGAEADDTKFRGFARLSHRVPAGPEILAPGEGKIVPDGEHLIVRWTPVTEAIIPELGPVEVSGYHALVVDVTEAVLPPGKTKTQFDADVPASANSILVPEQFLEPGRIYEFEILTAEVGGNQTITEGGVFCTPPIEEQDCVKP